MCVLISIRLDKLLLRNTPGDDAVTYGTQLDTLATVIIGLRIRMKLLYSLISAFQEVCVDYNYVSYIEWKSKKITLPYGCPIWPWKWIL
jgi:hypothetical protein